LEPKQLEPTYKLSSVIKAIDVQLEQKFSNA